MVVFGRSLPFRDIKFSYVLNVSTATVMVQQARFSSRQHRICHELQLVFEEIVVFVTVLQVRL